MSSSVDSVSTYGPSHPVRTHDVSLSKQSSSKFSVAQALAIDYLRNSTADADSAAGSSVWRLEEKNNSGITVWSRPGIGHSIEIDSINNDTDTRLLRTVLTINSSAETVFEILKDHQQTIQWHPSIDKSEPLYYLDDSTRLSYLTFKPQMGGVISARHSVEVVRWGKVNAMERELSLIVTSSIPTELDSDPINELPTFSKENKKKIRQINYLVAYVVVPTSATQCQLVWFLEADIKGWLTPSRTLSPMVAKNIETLKALKAYCEKK